MNSQFGDTILRKQSVHLDHYATPEQISGLLPQDRTRCSIPFDTQTARPAAGMSPHRLRSRLGLFQDGLCQVLAILIDSTLSAELLPQPDL